MTHPNVVQEWTDALAEIKRLRTLNAELLEALRPLAVCLNEWESRLDPFELETVDPETFLLAPGITVSKARKARATIAKAEGR